MKIKASTEKPAPRTKKEVRGFLKSINYIGRFIVKLITTCEPFFKLLRKNEPMKWNDDCQVAFTRIKTYLLNPPILVSLVPTRLLIMYLAVHDTSVGCVLEHQDETRRESRPSTT